MGEDGGVRNVCQGTEYRKEYGCSGNVERFPLTEDHNSEGKESGTGYADFEVPGGNGPVSYTHLTLPTKLEV